MDFKERCQLVMCYSILAYGCIKYGHSGAARYFLFAVLSLVLYLPLNEFFTGRAASSLASSDTGFQDIDSYLAEDNT
jgi:hypothetical protein